MASDPSTWKLPRLRIDRDGLWYHEDQEVTHEGILATLRDGLLRDAEGHYLQIGSVRVPVEVDDAPLVVIRAEDDAELRLALHQRLSLAVQGEYRCVIATDDEQRRCRHVGQDQ